MGERDLVAADPKEVGREYSNLWDTLREGAPDVAKAAMISTGRAPATQLDSHPGFKMWLLTEFALNTPDKVISREIEAVRDEQVADSIAIDNQWPNIGKRQVGWHRRNLITEWQPLRAKLENQIQQVGVIRKNARLLALQGLYERVNSLAFTEKNNSGGLYLVPEVRNILKAIGEEIGDLGREGTGDDALKEIAIGLLEVLSIQGSGVQNQEDTVETFDYDKDLEGEFTEVEEQAVEEDATVSG